MKWVLHGTGSERGGLLREIENLQRIPPDPYRVQVLGACMDHPDGRPRLVMQYCPHGSLKKYTRSNPDAVTWEFVYKALKMAAGGIASLHRLRPAVIHRDVRAANLLVAVPPPHLVVKVTDFGLSHSISDLDAVESATVTTVGPVPWMAPETLRASMEGGSQVVSPMTDVYMFGGVIFELLSGKSPYDGDSGKRCRDRRLADPELTPIVDLRMQSGIAAGDVTTPTPWTARIESEGTVEGLERLMKRCWSTEPADRPTMSQVMKELDDIDAMDGATDDTYPEDWSRK